MIKKIRRISEVDKKETTFDTKTILPEIEDEKFAEILESFRKKAESISESISIQDSNDDRDQEEEEDNNIIDKPKIGTIFRQDILTRRKK